MYSASANFNTTANQSGRETSLKIYYPDQDIEITDEDIILAFSFSDTLVEDESKSYIGSFIAKTIKYQIDMLNPDFIALISKNAKIEVSVGLKVNGTYEYVPMGTYTVVDFSHDKKTGNAEIEAYDYSLAFDYTYNYTIESPMTIAQYASALCFMVGIELGSVSWFNSDLIVNPSTFVGGTYRNAIQMIAEATLTFAKIGRDDKLYFKKFTASGLTLDNVFENEVKDTYGPVNQVVFRKGDTGDDILDKNQTSIGANGLTEIVLDDNEIINWQDRETIISDYLTEIDGFTYDVALIEFPGNPAIDSGDILSYIDGDDVTHTLYVFNHNFEHAGGWYATIEAVALSRTMTNANYVGNYDKRITNAEILVNKVDGEITAVVESQDDLKQGIANNTAQININAQAITQRVTATYVENKIAEINQATPNRVSNLPDNYAQGDILLGVNADSDYHIRTRAFYPIRTGFVTVQIAEPYEAKIVLYDSSFSYVETTSYGDLYTFSLSGASFFKVVVRNANTNMIDVSEIETSQLKVANESSATAWNLYFGDYTLEAQRDLYQFFIQSTEGLVFDEDTTSLTLNAVVLLNTIDVTDLQLDNQFAWSRKSKDSTKDLAFNNLGLTGKQLVLGLEYLDRSATYMCTYSIPDTAYLNTKTGDRLLTFDNDYIVVLVSEVI